MREIASFSFLKFWFAPSDLEVQDRPLEAGADAGVLPAVPVQLAPDQPDRHGGHARRRSPDREQQPRTPLRRGLQAAQTGG